MNRFALRFILLLYRALNWTRNVSDALAQPKTLRQMMAGGGGRHGGLFVNELTGMTSSDF
jgi:hypothetical protein